jgi:hypothetical protein
MPTYQKTSPFKRGDTFSATCTYKQNNVAVAITTQSIASQVRAESGKLVSNLLVTINPDQITNPGKFTLTLATPTDTRNWPAPENVYCDIQVTDNGTVVSTSTFIIPVAVDITR